MAADLARVERGLRVHEVRHDRLVRERHVQDVGALEDIIARVSVMASDHAELRTLELHPVVVAEQGAAVLSARIDLASARRTDTSRRSLPT